MTWWIWIFVVAVGALDLIRQGKDFRVRVDLVLARLLDAGKAVGARKTLVLHDGTSWCHHENQPC